MEKAFCGIAKKCAAVALAAVLSTSALAFDGFDENPSDKIFGLSKPQSTALAVALPAASMALLMYGPETKPPYDKYAHAGVGAVMTAVMAEYTSPAVAVVSVVALGVGKEMLDKEYDPHDAAATIAGGLAGLALWYQFASNAKTRCFFGIRSFNCSHSF